MPLLWKERLKDCVRLFDVGKLILMAVKKYLIPFMKYWDRRWNLIRFRHVRKYVGSVRVVFSHYKLQLWPCHLKSLNWAELLQTCWFHWNACLSYWNRYYPTRPLPSQDKCTCTWFGGEFVCSSMDMEDLIDCVCLQTYNIEDQCLWSHISASAGMVCIMLHDIKVPISELHY